MINIPVYVSVTQSGIGNAIFKVADIYTGTLDQSGKIVQGLPAAKVTVQNEQVLTVVTTLEDRQPGRSVFHQPAGGSLPVPDHREQSPGSRPEGSGSSPGSPPRRRSFLAYNLVTVEWEVSGDDRPGPIRNRPQGDLRNQCPGRCRGDGTDFGDRLPAMKTGDVLNGEFTLTNYGLVRADHLQYVLPSDDPYFKYELLTAIPASLGARERITIPYRIVCLKALNPAQDGGSERRRMRAERPIRQGDLRLQVRQWQRFSQAFPSVTSMTTASAPATSGKSGRRWRWWRGRRLRTSYRWRRGWGRWWRRTTPCADQGRKMLADSGKKGSLF